MITRSKLICSLLMLVAARSRAGAEEVIIADLREWTHAIAFYVDAPSSIAKEMNAALEQARESREDSCASQTDPKWPCAEKPVRFLRGINGIGEKSKSGYICEDVKSMTRQKYYPDRMMEDWGCIKVTWHGYKKGYLVAWPEPGPSIPGAAHQ